MVIPAKEIQFECYECLSSIFSFHNINDNKINEIESGNLPAAISFTLFPRRSSESGILNVTADLFDIADDLASSVIGVIPMFELFTNPFLSTV